MSWSFQTAAPVKNSRRLKYNLVKVVNSENNWLTDSITVSPPLSSLHSAHRLSNCPHRRLPDPRDSATCRVIFVVSQTMKTATVIIVLIALMGCATNIRVINLDGDPIDNAMVIIEGEKYSHQKVYTDNNGEFKYSKIHLGGNDDKWIRIQKNGYFEKIVRLDGNVDDVIRMVPETNSTANPGIIYKK